MRLPLKSDFLPLVRSGRKRSTVRAGRRRAELGPAEIVSDGVRIPVQLTGIEYKIFAHLTDKDAVVDGLASRIELQKVLLSFYPSLSDDDTVTIIHFELEPIEEHRSIWQKRQVET